jgi:hypothetical protein
MRKPTGILARWRQGWRQLLALTLMMTTLLWATNKGPDAGNYTATDNTVYSFLDPAGSGGGASVLTGVDDGVALLTLPFPFQFYGQSYTLVCASSNGVAYFVTTADACNAVVDFANTDLTSTAAPGDLPAVAPFWMDLDFSPPGAGAVYYQSVGAVGSRRFVIEWSNVYPTGTPNPATFEAVLYEGSNNILFQYQTVDLGADNPASKGALATVGIRNTGGSGNNQQIQWSYDAGVLVNNGAILFNAPSSTASSVNTVTTAPPGLTVTIDGTATATPAVVSWAPGTNHTLSVVTPQTNGGTATVLTSWSTGETTAQITVPAPTTGTTFTATFATQYLLTATANPSNEGSVSGGGFYTAGSVAVVQATVLSPNRFAGFSGDLTGATNPQNLTMNGPKNVVANFSAYNACDLQQNGNIAVADVQIIINEALGTAAAVNDLNGDGVVNITDVQIEINAALGLACSAK